MLDFFMGHRDSLRRSYFIPDRTHPSAEIIDLLEVEYSKALPWLTIFAPTPAKPVPVDEKTVRIEALEKRVSELEALLKVPAQEG